MNAPKFDVEHTINMYADGFVIMPASQIYNKEFVNSQMHIIEKCHIYMIGYMPDLSVEGFAQDDRNLDCIMNIGLKTFTRKIKIPAEFDLRKEDGKFFLENTEGKKIVPNIHALFADQITFKVDYIGQAYGKDASRNALERLLKHETLQKISLQKAPPNCQLYVLLIELIAANRI